MRNEQELLNTYVLRDINRMRTGRPPVFDKQQIISMYAAGKSYRDVAAVTGCSPRHVNRLTFAQRLVQQSQLQKTVSTRKDISSDISPSMPIANQKLTSKLSAYSRKALEGVLSLARKQIFELEEQNKSFQAKIQELSEDNEGYKEMLAASKKKTEQTVSMNSDNKQAIIDKIAKVSSIMSRMLQVAPGHKHLTIVSKELHEIDMLVDPPSDYD